MNESDTPSNYWLLCIIYVCYLLNHITYSKDLKTPTMDRGEGGSPNVPSEGSHTKTISTRVPNDFFRSTCDQDPSAVNPMSEFDPNEKYFSLTLENGEQITKKVTEF